jgi:hypothetical protein
MERIGLFEKKLFPLFGYYPWECSGCRKRFLLKARGVKIRRGQAGVRHPSHHRIISH